MIFHISACSKYVTEKEYKKIEREMLLDKVFEILMNKRQERSLGDPKENVSKNEKEEANNIDVEGDTSLPLQRHSEAGGQTEKSETSDPQKVSYSSHFESGSDESKTDRDAEVGGKTDKCNSSEPQEDSYSSHFDTGTDESNPDAAAQVETEDIGPGTPKNFELDEIISSRILNTSNELSEVDVPDDDPASESQTSDYIPQAAVPVPEPHPLAGEAGWNVLSTIEEVTTVADTQTGQDDLTTDLSGQKDTDNFSYSTSDDTYKQTQAHFDTNQSEDLSEEEVQSLSVDNKALSSSLCPEVRMVQFIDEGVQETQSRHVKTETMFSESQPDNDGDGLASVHSLTVSSDISDSVKSNKRSDTIIAGAVLREEDFNSEAEFQNDLKINEKETRDIVEDIIEKAVRMSEGERSITPCEFIALSVHETDDDGSLIEEHPDPVSVEVTPASPAAPDPASVTVDDSSTEAVRLSAGEVLLTGLISEGELTASEGASLVTQTPGDTDTEPGEADPRPRLPVSLDTSSSSSWSEGEWRASPARMRRFLNMASAFRMINKSDQE